MLVRLNDVSKSFGSFDLLENVSFEIHSGEKVGLVGVNGAGKTTLFRLIQYLEQPDAGEVNVPGGVRLGRLHQTPEFGEAPVLNEALKCFSKLQQTEQRLRTLELKMATETATDVLDEYAQLQHAFELGGGYNFHARAEAALLGVGIHADRWSQSAGSLSGGEKNRLALAQLLLTEADLLLLDEPTNHLDIRGIEWLENRLRETKTSLLIASHDRLFLDRIVTRVLSLEDGRIHDYSGNYSCFVRERRERLELQRKEWQRQQEWMDRTEDYIRRNIAGQKSRQAKSRRKALERIQPIQRPPSPPPKVRFRFLPPSNTRRQVIQARNLQVGFSSPILEDIDIEIERGQRWAFLGPNGSGKTTLLGSLIGRLSPLGGELDWDPGICVGYYDQAMEDLDDHRTVLEELRFLDSRATDGELRSFLAQFLFRGEDVFKRIAQLSGGERSKLMLAKIVYAAPSMLALDEPTNHLDIASREVLESALIAYPGTMLFISHDRQLVSHLATHILYVADRRVQRFDDFDQFERWLEHDVTAASSTAATQRKREPDSASRQGLSKNRRDRLESQIRGVEEAIRENERALQVFERQFQRPPDGIDWNETNRRYLELKAQNEALYGKLARQLDLLGQPEISSER